MNEITIFNNEEFGTIRAIERDGEPWFIGKDICQIFGDKNHSRSLGRIEAEDKREEEIVDAMGRKQKAIYINESGFYSLLFAMQPQKSNKNGVSDAYPIEVKERIEKLKKFKRWVTSEVLPSIRKHGVYMTDSKAYDLLHNENSLADLLLQAGEQLKQKNIIIEEMRPKAIFADAVSASNQTILVGELAKILRQNGIVDMGQNRLFETLRNRGYLIKGNRSDRNMPTQRSLEMGLFEIKETAVTHSDGHVTVNKTPKVTGKGQQYFINLFKGKELNSQPHQ